MVSVSSVLMAPVRGVVWLIKLPFVLVWMLLRYMGLCIYRAVAAILSLPAYYLGRARDRLRLTWAWAKGSATRFKLSLPFTSNCSTHGSLKALPPPRNEYNTYHVYNTEGAGPYGSSGARRRRRSDRKSRKAIAEALTKLLLEPCSPSDSDEDSEAMRSSQSEEVDERSVKLIMDLLKLSKSDGDSQVRPTITPQDLQALRERTRNKQQLESLIAEVDQMARDVDPSIVLSKGQGQGSQLCPPSSVESDHHQPKRKHKTHKSSSSQAKKTSKSSRDTYKLDRDQDEEGVGEGLEEEESSQYTGGAMVPQHRHKYMGDLSPVQESPEYKPEETNYQELEKDLNLALSKLHSEISQLPSDLTEETQITHTVMTITSAQQQQQQPAEEEDDSLFQDSHEEFPSVPKVQPSLGLKAGHARRDIAAARKPRPPSRKVTAAEQQGNAREQMGKWDDLPLSDVEDSWDEEDSELGDPDGSSGSEGEGKGEGEIPGHYKQRQRPKKLCGGIELSDQLRLLSPTPKSSLQSEIGEVNSSSGLADSADVASLYASVNKKKKSSSENRPRTNSDPTPTATGQSGLTSRGSSHSMTSDLGDRGELEDSWKEKSSPRITSNQPPWIEMRTRKKSDDSDPLPSSTPLLSSSQPPWIEMRSHKNSSGYSSSASTPTTTNAPPSSLHSTPHSTPSTPSTTRTAPQQHVHDLSSSHRVLPPKPAIPRPEPPPPPSSSTSETLLRTYSTEDEEEEESNAVKLEDSTESFYDSLQPKDEAPQCESRIFPLHEYRQDRPKYLHEVISDSQKREETASISSVSSRGRRGGSLRLRDPSPTLSQKNPASRLKRTSSADTMAKTGKSHERPKQRHSSSSSTRRLEERRSSDSHRQRNRSSSGERTPLSQRSSDRQKRGSSSSSTKSSPSPRESSAGTLSTVWKLLATPTSSRSRQSSSGGKDSKKRNGERDKHSSSSDSLSRDESPPSTKSKVKQSPSKADKK